MSAADPPSGPAVRASDSERELTVDVLRAAAVEGRLTLEELAERVERALVATTRDELAPLTGDLPAPVEARSHGSRWKPLDRRRHGRR